MLMLVRSPEYCCSLFRVVLLYIVLIDSSDLRSACVNIGGTKSDYLNYSVIYLLTNFCRTVHIHVILSIAKNRHSNSFHEIFFRSLIVYYY